MPSQLTTDDQALRLFFTEDLYLVTEPGIQETPAITKDEALIDAGPEYRSLGNNKRNILILVNDAENEVSDEAGKELLRKIVKSVNLTANDFALLNYSGYKHTSLEKLKSHFASVIVFAFGVSAAELGLNTQPENTIVTHEGTRLIFSAELKKLEADANAKKLLWSCLKQLGL